MIDPQLQQALLAVLQQLAPAAPTRARRERAPGCGRPLGPESMVSVREISLETGHGEDAIATLLKKRRKQVRHTRVKHGKGELVRYCWREALAVVIRELGGGGLTGGEQAGDGTGGTVLTLQKLPMARV